MAYFVIVKSYLSTLSWQAVNYRVGKKTNFIKHSFTIQVGITFIQLVSINCTLPNQTILLMDIRKENP
jgi:hypothetical protein